MLDFVLAAVKRVSRHEAIHVNRPYQLSASTSLIAELDHQIFYRFNLGLIREDVYVRIRLVGQSAEQLHGGNIRATRISAKCAVGSDPECESWVHRKAGCLRAGAKAVKDIGSRGRPHSTWAGIEIAIWRADLHQR